MIINEKKVQSVMTRSSLPVGSYSVNPYVGCTHACKYCYASFMKRFTGHTEPWGTFLDVKQWPAIKDLLPLYDDIYRRKRRDYWQTLAQQVETYAKDHGIPYVINDLPYGRSEHGHPVVVNYFYHEEIRQKR